eukprot:TRINITY_DN1588_c0_g1_i2.p1 TRINITY_DN1588_c0_g1~~TRINITY_DN1588_c0_g1_i2.p1  ORF type:complete len:201 (+),score=43.53 TRINITY_DN1588_c0_g1_i2:111-713(+)
MKETGDEDVQKLKLVVVGDNDVGKTSQLITYRKNAFPHCYLSSTCENFDMDVTVDEKPVTVSLWDCAGGEEYARLRPLAYPETDLFLIEFSIAEPSSLLSAKSWLSEIHHHCPDVPVFLIGNKSDLRQDPEILEKMRSKSDCVVSNEQALAVCEEIGAIKYLENSALKKQDFQPILEEAVRAVRVVRANTPVKTSTCSIF